MKSKKWTDFKEIKEITDFSKITDFNGFFKREPSTVQCFYMKIFNVLVQIMISNKGL